MRTELKIYGNNIWYNVDLYDNEPLPLTKEIKDLYEPDKNQSDFTKTIKIPGTHNNNQIFSNIFDINHAVISTTQFTNDFNPNLKANCILYRDGIPQIRGYLQLTNIILVDQYKVDYEIVVIGRNANLFQDLGDKKLIELDLSDYDHVWNSTNVDASWTAPVGVGYVYPLIDRGYDPSEIAYYYDQTYPAVYVKTLVDKIFSEAGYRYSSSFFATDRFKRLIIPFTGAAFKMSAEDVQDRLFELAFNSASAYIANPAGGFTKVLFPNTIKDSSPAGVASNGWEIPTGYDGNYIFRTELNCTLKYIGIASYSNDSVIFNARIIRIRSGVTAVVNSNLVTIPWSGAITTNSTLNITYNLQTAITDFIAGDEFYVEWFFTTLANLATPTDLEIRFNAGSSFFNSTDGQYNFGATISLKNALPQDVKQKDFLTSLIKMFNLYFEPDQIDDKKLVIEPRDDFYTSNVIDLTNKLDVSREINILPMGALDFKTLEFHSAKDDDQYNKYYNDRYENEYGYRKIIVSNDFLVETKRIETIFAPTPLVDFDTNNRVISKIRYFNSDGTLKTQAAKPRILYYGGLLDTGLGTYALSTSRNPLSRTYKTQYAYAGHLDSVASPTFDLSWGVPELIFYGSGTGATLKDANLYNLYWKKSIEEITDKNSKLMECYIHFTNVDLQNISFRNFYLIDRQYYRLYRIETDLNSELPAKCTFLKLKVAPTFTPSTGIGNGGTGEIGDELLPDLTYYNNPQFIDWNEQMKFEIVEVTEVTQLFPRSQFVKSTVDLYLPDAGASYDYITNKTIEIKVYNNDGATIKVFYTEDLYFNVSSNGAHSFVTDGTNWFKF